MIKSHWVNASAGNQIKEEDYNRVGYRPIVDQSLITHFFDQVAFKHDHCGKDGYKDKYPLERKAKIKHPVRWVDEPDQSDIAKSKCHCYRNRNNQCCNAYFQCVN